MREREGGRERQRQRRRHEGRDKETERGIEKEKSDTQVRAKLTPYAPSFSSLKKT